MSTAELLEQLRGLSNVERLAIIEAATRLVRDDLAVPGEKTQGDLDERLAKAAARVAALYEPGGELSEWTSLDAEEVLDGDPSG